MNKKNNNVLITGAGKRIGASIATSLAANNWNIALHYNTSEKETCKLSTQLEKKFNIKTVCVQADLSDLKQVKNIIPTASKKLGNINCLINNAASFEYDSINSLSSDSWDLHINTNIRAPLFLSQSFVKSIS
ncbi:MAG: SDR family NAD(P)-dependent oxidoreductase, partial [Pelagibacterales bacterium]|nr:SDR family NAD(P)-dependent oxidoreductase [Pelagibacterales bacterium]